MFPTKIEDNHSHVRRQGECLSTKVINIKLELLITIMLINLEQIFKV